MLALYHLFSGTAPGQLLGVDALMADAGIKVLPTKVKRVVLVGNKISPGNPSVKGDGTVMKTMWASWPGSSAEKGFAKVAPGRRAGNEPRRYAAQTVERVRAVPDPDRRVGRLRPAAP